MEYASIIVSIIAVLVAVVALLKVNTYNRALSGKLERLKDRNSILEHQLTEIRGMASRGGKRGQGSDEAGAPTRSARENQRGAGNVSSRSADLQEQQPRQKKKRNEYKNPQNTDSAEQPAPQQRTRGGATNVPADGEVSGGNPRGQQREQREPREPREPRVQQGGQREPRETRGQQGEPREPKEQREPRERREPREPREPRAEQQGEQREQQPERQPARATRQYAIIPEDGIIKQHQLQQQPDSDSYLEVDAPADGNSNTTRYRFNLSGNQAFVISQGIDRLENAFSFEKPSNRKVSQVVLQDDGVLTRVGNGWRIQEKAKIDFR